MATTTTTVQYGTPGSLAVTSLVSLADGAWCSSAIFDNSSELANDVLIGGSVQVGAPTADGTIDVYAAGSWDGTEFGAGVSAGDGGITWGTTGTTHVNGEFDLVFLGSMSIDSTDDNKDVSFGPFNIAQAFGGIVPKKFAVVFENNTGAALHGTGTNNHIDTVAIHHVGTTA